MVTGKKISPSTAIAATAALELAQKITPNNKSSDIVNTDSALNPNPAQPIQTPSGTVNTAPANQTYTQDNRKVKQWAADQIKSAYSQATAIADSEGFGGEYRARVDPIVNQGLNAINSIPDQQTVTVPAASTQVGGSPNGQ
jgi:hypothetical protein